MLDAPLSTSEVAQRTGLSIGASHGISRSSASRVSLPRTGVGTRSCTIPTPLGLSLLEADGHAPFAEAG